MVEVKKVLQLAKLFLGWPLAIIAISLITKYLLDNSSNILPRLTGADPILLVASVFCFLIYYFMRAIGWGLLMKIMGHNLELSKNAYAWQFSEIKRYVPGNIWSFLSRATMFEDLGVSKKISGKAILLEIEFLVVSNLVLSLFSLNLITQYYGETTPGIMLVLVLIALSAVIFLLVGYKTSTKLAKILPDFGLDRNLLILIFYTSTFFFLSLGTYLTTAAILGTNIGWLTLIGIFSFAFLVGYLSLITPSGLGVREGVITFGLASFFTSPIAGLIAVFSRIILVITELVFTFLVYIWNKLRS